MRYDSLGIIAFSKSRKDDLYEEGSWSAKETPEGFLRLTGYFTRTGTFSYSDGEGNTWGEHRPESEVFDPETLKSFGLMILTDDHPEEFVTVENVDQYKRGMTGDLIEREGDRVRGQILVTDADLIQKIKGGKVELSVGYRIEPDETPGIDEDGNPYEIIQRGIRGNHLAVVDQGRAGPTCRLVMDSGDAFSALKDTVMKKKDQDDVEALKLENEALRAKVEEQAAMLAKLAEESPSASSSASMKMEELGMEEMPMDEDAPMADPAKEEPKMDSLRAQVDMLKAQLARASKLDSAKIDARVALVSKAKEILGADCKTDGLSDIEVKRAIVAHLTPEVRGKLDKASDAYVDGAYEIALAGRQSKLDGEFLSVASRAFNAQADKSNVLDIESAIRKRYGR